MFEWGHLQDQDSEHALASSNDQDLAPLIVLQFDLIGPSRSSSGMHQRLGFGVAFCALAFVLSGCRQPTHEVKPQPEPVGKTEASSDRRITISVIGTNDVHGHLSRLPIFAGYMANLRAARSDGGVLLVDGGDMFQGTLESNLSEGAPVVAIYNALGYDAVTIGNHEFDFGPVGKKAVPQTPQDDPRGALRARAAEASFPFLMANVVDKSGKTPGWSNVSAKAIIDVAGLKVGLIGLTTINTPKTTIANNFRGLNMTDLAEAVIREASAMRTAGVSLIVVIAHAGAKCHEFYDPYKIESCEPGEIFAVAERIPTGLVDVIVGGHTHAGVAHRVNGIAIIESYAKGRAFGRVDLMVRDGVLKESVIFPPRDMCSGKRALNAKDCNPGSYEGQPVVADKTVAAIVEKAERRAEKLREQSLGVILENRLERSHGEESALGNLFVDLMLEARQGDVAIINGGGLRADLPQGELRYGSLFKAMPFDNRFATVKLRAVQFAKMIANNLASTHGFISVAGISARAKCVAGSLQVSLFRANGKRIKPTAPLTVIVSDFIASGGDGVFANLGLAKDAIEFEEGEMIRDAMANVLRKQTQPIRRIEVFNPKSPRIKFDGERPLSCK